MSSTTFTTTAIAATGLVQYGQLRDEFAADIAAVVSGIANVHEANGALHRAARSLAPSVERLVSETGEVPEGIDTFGPRQRKAAAFVLEAYRLNHISESAASLAAEGFAVPAYLASEAEVAEQARSEAHARDFIAHLASNARTVRGGEIAQAFLVNELDASIANADLLPAERASIRRIAAGARYTVVPGRYGFTVIDRVNGDEDGPDIIAVFNTEAQAQALADSKNG